MLTKTVLLFISKIIRRQGQVKYVGGGDVVWGDLHAGYWWKHQWKEPAGRPKRKWLDNIKIHLQYIGLKGVDLIHLAQERDKKRPVIYKIIRPRLP
jgi:hypothetical protein